MSKLYELKRGDKFIIHDEDSHPPAHRQFIDGEVITFDHIDGMYSLCFDSNGDYVHVRAWEEVELVEGTQDDENE